MRPLLAIVAVLVVVVATASSAGTGNRDPALRLTSRQPPIVRGIEFKASERVRVSITAQERVTKVVRASRQGVFVASFPAMLVTRCDQIRVVAVGRRGSHAVLKLLPRPMCLPQRSP
jgi:hypothetical protein